MKSLYEELYDYATLEAAYEAAFLYLDGCPRGQRGVADKPAKSLGLAEL